MNPYASPEWQHILQAVLAAPADDGLRLVAADWLEEQGEADRAEFIRIGILRAKDVVLCPERGLPGGKRRRREEYQRRIKAGDVLRQREKELLNVNAAGPGCGTNHFRWLPDCLQVKQLAGGCSYERGFPKHLAVPGDDWLEQCDAILCAAPIQEVQLTTMPVMEFTWLPFEKSTLCWLAGRKESLTRQHYKNGSGDEGDPGVQREVVRELLAKEWPRLKFTLPSLSAASLTISGHSIGEVTE